MKYFFHPKAKEEFFEAIKYYEECSPGLSFEFSKEESRAVAIRQYNKIRIQY
jgi:hypothetical protein